MCIVYEFPFFFNTGQIGLATKNKNLIFFFHLVEY